MTSGNYGTPVNYGLTSFAVCSIGIAIVIAISSLIKNGKLCIMIVPRIYVVIDHSFNGNASAKEISIIHDTLYYLAVNFNNRTISCLKLAVGSNGSICYMVNTVPCPKTYGNAEESLGSFVKLIAVSFNSNSNNLLNLVKLNSSYLESLCGNNTLRFPSICSLKCKSYGHLVYGSNIGNINIHIVN